MKAPTAKPMTTTMYSVVFGSAWVKCGVLMLLAFLLLQPASLAFGNTVEQAAPRDESMPEVTEEPTVSNTKLQEDEELPSEQTEEDAEELQAVLNEEAAEQEDGDEAIGQDEIDNGIETTQPDTADVQAQATTSTEASAVAADSAATTSATSSEVISEGDTNNDEVVEENSETIEDNETEETTSTNDENQNEEMSDEQATATSTAEADSIAENVLTVDHNANQLQFNQKECASVGDGAFYCSTPSTPEESVESAVFAAPDADGDMEIFVRLEGAQQQLTSNQVDDNAPFYDALSDRIVWHAMLNDRYQIMSYDMRTQETTQLTKTTYNNMEPIAYGEITMYQSWIDNNWEIIFNENGDERRLTANTQHDVSPHIRGGYIVWQSQFEDGWQVAVYDQETDHVEYVQSEGGAKVENPRFVLVYDSTNHAGDIQTVGYDFDNKRSFTLNSIPADLPDELPEPDQTGETRALIQNKQTVRGTEIEETDVVPTNTNTSSSTATSSEASIPAVDLTASSTPQAGTSTPISAPIEDLIIVGTQTATATPDISHIPDILIPPQEATSSAEIR